MKTLLNALLPGLTLLAVTCAAVSVWTLEPLTTKQKFVVIPAIEKEIKIRVVSAIDYQTKVRPIGHVGRSIVALRDRLEKSDSIPAEICMLRDGEWRERIQNTPCFDVGEQAMRFKRGEAVLVTRTKSKLNEIIGDCFIDEGRLYCLPFEKASLLRREL